MLLALAVALASCAGAAESAAGQDRPQVVVTLNVLADLAAEVGQDRIEVDALVPLGGDPHLYEPTPGDAVAVAEADLVLTNGHGLEPWADQLLEPAGREAVAVADGIGGEILRDEAGRPDPHLWMDPTLVAGYVEVIADALAEVDPDDAPAYARDAARYTDELLALDQEIDEELARIPDDRRRLVTSHDAYSYFARRYDLEVTGTVLGVSTETEPSAQHLGALIDRIRELDVPVVFLETTVNPSVIERVARDAGVDIGAPLYGDSLGEPGSGAETYADMLRHNARAIADGLAGDA